MGTNTQCRRKGLPEAFADYIRVARELGLSITDDMKDLETLAKNGEQFLGVIEVLRKKAKERIDLKAEIIKKFVSEQQKCRK